MSDNLSPTYINLMRELVEKRFGRKAVSPEDFQALSDDLLTVTRQPVSVSTIKRLWGYVASPHTPRNSILSVFAMYIGYRDWNAFVAEADAKLLPDSGYLTADMVFAADLQPGDTVTLCWPPDRRCVVKCIAPLRFEVIESEGAKLKAGATFSATMFAVGNPLYATDVSAPGEAEGHETYVAARISGLTKVEVSRAH